MAPSPSVSGIAPAEGPSVGGTAVKITGSNLAEATAVKFGETEAQSFTVTSATTITAIAPAGTGTVGVTVQTRFGTTTAGGAEQYKYTATGPPPAVSKLSAKRGPAAGGTALTITGSGFTAVSAVDFGNAAAQSFTVKSPELIVVESTPPGTAGTQNVTVTTPFGTSPASKHATFKYENPVITNVNPDTGPKQGANKVTVTGNGFVPGETSSIFKFGKSPATEIECFSSTRCTMTAPAAKKPGTVDVTVKAVKAASKKTEADHYTLLRLNQPGRTRRASSPSSRFSRSRSIPELRSPERAPTSPWARGQPCIVSGGPLRNCPMRTRFHP